MQPRAIDYKMAEKNEEKNNVIEGRVEDAGDRVKDAEEERIALEKRIRDVKKDYESGKY